MTTVDISFEMVENLDDFFLLARLEREAVEKQVKAAKREARVAEAAAGDKRKAGGDQRCGIWGYGHSTAYCPHHVPQYYKAADEEVRRPMLDKDNIPKGFALAPMEYARMESGECYQGPPLCVVPMMCFFVTRLVTSCQMIAPRDNLGGYSSSNPVW